MKIKLNIRDHVRQFADGDNRLTFEASVDVDNLFDTAHLPDEFEVDLDELLQQNRIIGHLWTINDVREVRPQLTEEQAWEVLRESQDSLAVDERLNWNHIEKVADDLFGVETQRLVRFTDLLEKYTDFDSETNLVDLLADAMHWCQSNDEDFDGSVAKAKRHFHTETKA